MVAPSKFAHVVFNTHRYEEMIDWYARVFEARVQPRDDRLAFLTYDDEHHRFAFANLGPAKDNEGERPAMAAGLNHLGYTWRNLEELMDTSARLKSQGVMPTRPIRHGLTLSLYYRNPDGNGLEFQIDLMEAKDANEFMSGPAPLIRSANLSTRNLWWRGLRRASRPTISSSGQIRPRAPRPLTWRHA